MRALLQTPRGQLSHAEKTSLWNSQGRRCNACSEAVALEDADCDHILALDEGGTNSLDNFQLLCRTPCHQEKSNDEAFRASYETLESRFGPSGYEAYVSSPKV